MEFTLNSAIEAVFYAILVLIAAKFVEWLIEYLHNFKTYYKIKRWPTLPLIGNLHLIKNNGRDFLCQVSEMAKQWQDEPFYSLWRGWKPVVVIHKAENLDMLFSSSKHTVKSMDYDFLKPWLGTGLLISDGDKWNFRRRILTPSFHFDILNEFLDVMNTNADTCVSNLKKYAETGEEVDIFKHIGLCALDTICETAMGENINAQTKSESEYIKAVAIINVLIRRRTMNPLFWYDFIYMFTKEGKEHARCLKLLHKFTRDIIMKRDQEFDSSNYGIQKRVAFLDLLLKIKHEDNKLTFDDIQEEVDTFMFEGHDTTSCVLAWAFHLIGSHPDVQKKIQSELEDIFGDSDRFVTNDDLGNLKYLECVIKESLRLFPSVPFHGRIITEDTQVAGQRFKKGLSVVIFTYMIHRDPRYYPEPEKFDPTRFLPENSRDRHPFAYIPFSAGRRNCIGQRFAMMEMKVILSKILRRYNIVSLKSTEELEPCADIILKPNKGVPVILSQR